jgi:hypothetical protein
MDLVRLATVLHANRQVSMTGEMTFERINARAFGEALGIGPQFEGESRGNLKFSATADNWPAILSALQASGDFSMHRGSLGSIDLPEAVRRVRPRPLTLGGRTRFEELSGGITLTPGLTLLPTGLNAGLMHSSGQIEVSRNCKLRGRMEVQMRGRADHTAVPILISGHPQVATAADRWPLTALTARQRPARIRGVLENRRDGVGDIVDVARIERRQTDAAGAHRVDAELVTQPVDLPDVLRPV